MRDCAASAAASENILPENAVVLRIESEFVFIEVLNHTPNANVKVSSGSARGVKGWRARTSMSESVPSTLAMRTN